MFEWIPNMEEEFIIGVLYDRKGNLGYSDCSKYLTYFIESQIVGFGIQASLSMFQGWWEPVKIASYRRLKG